jgi:hypothetical protein
MPELPETLHNWKTAEPYLKGGDVPWLTDDLSKIRISAYNFYDSVFMNAPDTWAVLMYETNRRPLYIPSAKILVNALNRYIAPNMDVVVDQQALLAAGGTIDPNQPDPAQPIRDLFHREMFYAKFAAEKRMGRVRGDWIFMIQGDELKVEGSRISLIPVDPASYFPIWSEEDPDVRIGAHIVTQWTMPGEDEVKIFRTTFRKETPPGVIGGPGQITVEESIFPIDEWGGPNMEEGESVSVRPLTPLDPRITEIPVYHIRSNYRSGEDFGTSDLSGLEAAMVAVNQGASDEDIALALTGLGVYETDAGPPLDPTTGETLPWRIGPSRVVEVPAGHHFGRVQGLTTIDPYQVHIAYIDDKIAQTMGLGQIALGNVAVDEAESGIALALKLAPTLSHAEEQELEITGKMRQMLNDIKAWLQVYEGINSGDFVFMPKYGEKIPVNRKQRIDELLNLFNANIVSGSYVRGQLATLGYDMPTDEEMMRQIVEEKQTMQQIVSDVTGSRIDSELGGDPVPAGSNGSA